MWRVLGRLASTSRGASRRVVHPRTTQPKSVVATGSVEWRFLSSDGGDGPVDSGRRQDIYFNLFGDDTPIENNTLDPFGKGTKSKKSTQLGSWELENDDDDDDTDDRNTTMPRITEADIPQPLWSGNMDITEERLMSKSDFDDVPEWSPDFVSRISKERIKLFEGMSWMIITKLSLEIVQLMCLVLGGFNCLSFVSLSLCIIRRYTKSVGIIPNGVASSTLSPSRRRPNQGIRQSAPKGSL